MFLSSSVHPYRDPQRALVLAKTALAKPSNHLEARTDAARALAQAHARVGEFASAIEWQERVVQEQTGYQGEELSRLKYYRMGQIPSEPDESLQLSLYTAPTRGNIFEWVLYKTLDSILVFPDFAFT